MCRVDWCLKRKYPKIVGNVVCIYLWLHVDSGRLLVRTHFSACLSTILLYYTTYYRIVCVPEILFNSFTRAFSSRYVFAICFSINTNRNREQHQKKSEKEKNPFTFISTSGTLCPLRTCRSLREKACRLYTVRFTRLNSRTSLTVRYTLTLSLPLSPSQIELRPENILQYQFLLLVCAV